MNTMNLAVLAPYSVWNFDEDDTKRVIMHVGANARNRKWIIANRREFTRRMQDAGFVDTFGCDCAHCRNDWDCCGRLFLSSVEVIPSRKGVKVVQHYGRNI